MSLWCMETIFIYRRLREIGFKTFGNYFDESYDLEQDPEKRINKIVSLCKDLEEQELAGHIPADERH